jgi:hypothetical protein
MKQTQLKGVLTIDHKRGVVYFHADGACVLRIEGLPTPVPAHDVELIDVQLDPSKTYKRTDGVVKDVMNKQDCIDRDVMRPAMKKMGTS